MSPKLVIVGFCNNDVNRYPDGSETRLPGGAAYFGALAASLFCQDVGLVTKLGSDFAAVDFLSRFPAAGLHRTTTSCSCSIQTYFDFSDPTQREVVLMEGASQEFTPGDVPADWIRDAGIVHVATMPPRMQRTFFEKILELRGTQPQPLISIDTEHSFLLDPAQLEQVKQMLPRADIVFLNRSEAQLLADVVPQLRSVVLKKDIEGAEVRTGGNLVAACGTRKVTVVDATGAGDVFAGVYLAATVEGSSVADSLALACDVATQSVEHEGIAHLVPNPVTPVS